MDANAAGDRYDGPAQILHWAVAILIAAAFAAILYAEGLPKGEARGAVVALHKSLGVVVAALVAARAARRLAVGAPPPPDMPRALRVAAGVGHALLYLAMAAVPVVGILMSWSAGRPVAVFGLFALPPLLGPDPALRAALAETHGALAWSLAALVGGHAAFAVYHQAVLRDGTLSRMLPGRRGG